jgi:hypothetical protein
LSRSVTLPSRHVALGGLGAGRRSLTPKEEKIMGQLCEPFDKEIFTALPFLRIVPGFWPDIIKGTFTRAPARKDVAKGEMNWLVP